NRDVGKGDSIVASHSDTGDLRISGAEFTGTIDCRSVKIPNLRIVDRKRRRSSLTVSTHSDLIEIWSNAGGVAELNRVITRSEFYQHAGAGRQVEAPTPYFHRGGHTVIHLIKQVARSVRRRIDLHAECTRAIGINIVKRDSV